MLYFFPIVLDLLPVFAKKTLLLSLREYHNRVPHSKNISITVFSADSDDLTQTCSCDLRRSLFGLPGARRTSLNDFWGPGNQFKNTISLNEKSRCFERLVEMCLRLRPRVWGTKAIPYLLKKTLTLPKHISYLTIFVTLVVKPSRARRTFVFLHKDNRILKRSVFFANTGGVGWTCS